MSRQRLIVLAVGVVALAQAGAVSLGGAGAAPVAAQTSEFDGVKITVEPRGPAGPATLDFAVTLETHLQPLDDDLVHSATLFADGRPYRPLGWQGSPPGGHHRNGVLRFRAVSPSPRTLELRIQRPGETRPRVFSWQRNQNPW